MNEYLGNNIRTLRKAKNLTQEQFSEQLGVSFQSVSRWENSITYPDIEMIPKIARFFGSFCILCVNEKHCLGEPGAGGIKKATPRRGF